MIISFLIPALSFAGSHHAQQGGKSNYSPDKSL
jgi:hypothetical protein